MNLTDENAREVMLKVASLPKKETFGSWGKEPQESYWSECSNLNNIQDYGFSTISELKDLLREVLDERIYTDLSLCLFKENLKVIIEMQKKNEVTEKQSESCFEIPEFVYNF